MAEDSRGGRENQQPAQGRLIEGIALPWLRGLNLTLSASVGFLALFGVAVLNGIVMVTMINPLREQGMELTQAVHRGAARRLRPVSRRGAYRVKAPRTAWRPTATTASVPA